MGAAIGLRNVKNPIRLARAIQGSDFVLLSGEAAQRGRAREGLATCPPEAFVTERERRRLAEWKTRGGASNPGADFGAPPRAATGRATRWGRSRWTASGASPRGSPPAACAGSPAGASATRRSRTAATSPTTGSRAWPAPAGARGSCAWASRAASAELARDNNAQDAAWLAIRELDDRIQGKAGVIVVARNGSIGWAFNTPFMALGYRDTETPGPIVKGLGLPG